MESSKMAFLELGVLLQIPKEIAIQYPMVYYWICIQITKEKQYNRFWDYYFFITNMKKATVNNKSPFILNQSETVVPKQKSLKMYDLMCKVYNQLIKESSSIKTKLYYSTINILNMEYKRRIKQEPQTVESFKTILTDDLLCDLDDSLS